MKVLMTADAVGGVWRYAIELARALAPAGVQITLVTMGPLPSPAQRGEAATIPTLMLVESEYRLEWMEAPWQDVARAGAWLLELAARLQPDVIHLNGYVHAALPWEAPVVVVAHSDVLSWWETVKGESAPAHWHAYRDKVRAGVHAANLLVAPTYAMLAAIEHQYGTPAVCRVIHNGRDAKAFRPLEKHKHVLAVGRIWDDAKNIASLVRLAPELPWSVHVAGEARGPDGTTTDLPGVEYLGVLSESEIARQFGHAAIYCHPARYEPFGLSILEAAHAGCVLVLADIPSLRELWAGAAEFVSPGDDRALRETLVSLMDDAPRRARLGSSARARARHLTPERQAAAYLREYELLVRRQPRARAAEARALEQDATGRAAMDREPSPAGTPARGPRASEATACAS